MNNITECLSNLESDDMDNCTSISQKPLNPLYVGEEKKDINLPTKKLVNDERFWQENGMPITSNKPADNVQTEFSSTGTFSVVNTHKTKYPVNITNWSPRINDNKLFIDGFINNVETSIVCKRVVSQRIFYDKDDKICSLNGPKIPRNKIPKEIESQFTNGIPDHWKSLLQSIFLTNTTTFNAEDADVNNGYTSTTTFTSMYNKSTSTKASLKHYTINDLDRKIAKLVARREAMKRRERSQDNSGFSFSETNFNGKTVENKNNSESDIEGSTNLKIVGESVAKVHENPSMKLSLNQEKVNVHDSEENVFKNIGKVQDLNSSRSTLDVQEKNSSETIQEAQEQDDEFTLNITEDSADNIFPDTISELCSDRKHSEIISFQTNNVQNISKLHKSELTNIDKKSLVSQSNNFENMFESTSNNRKIISSKTAQNNNNSSTINTRFESDENSIVNEQSTNKNGIVSIDKKLNIKNNSDALTITNKSKLKYNENLSDNDDEEIFNNKTVSLVCDTKNATVINESLRSKYKTILPDNEMSSLCTTQNVKNNSNLTIINSSAQSKNKTVCSDLFSGNIDNEINLIRTKQNTEPNKIISSSENEQNTEILPESEIGYPIYSTQVDIDATKSKLEQLNKAKKNITFSNEINMNLISNTNASESRLEETFEIQQIENDQMDAASDVHLEDEMENNVIYKPQIDIGKVSENSASSNNSDISIEDKNIYKDKDDLKKAKLNSEKQIKKSTKQIGKQTIVSPKKPKLHSPKKQQKDFRNTRGKNESLVEKINKKQKQLITKIDKGKRTIVSPKKPKLDSPKKQQKEFSNTRGKKELLVEKINKEEKQLITKIDKGILSSTLRNESKMNSNLSDNNKLLDNHSSKMSLDRNEDSLNISNTSVKIKKVPKELEKLLIKGPGFTAHNSILNETLKMIEETTFSETNSISLRRRSRTLSYQEDNRTENSVINFFSETFKNTISNSKSNISVGNNKQTEKEDKGMFLFPDVPKITNRKRKLSNQINSCKISSTVNSQEENIKTIENDSEKDKKISASRRTSRRCRSLPFSKSNETDSEFENSPRVLLPRLEFPMSGYPKRYSKSPAKNSNNINNHSTPVQRLRQKEISVPASKKSTERNSSNSLDRSFKSEDYIDTAVKSTKKSRLSTKRIKPNSKTNESVQEASTSGYRTNPILSSEERIGISRDQSILNDSNMYSLRRRSSSKRKNLNEKYLCVVYNKSLEKGTKETKSKNKQDKKKQNKTEKKNKNLKDFRTNVSMEDVIAIQKSTKREKKKQNAVSLLLKDSRKMTQLIKTKRKKIKENLPVTSCDTSQSSSSRATSEKTSIFRTKNKRKLYTEAFWVNSPEFMECTSQNSSQNLSQNSSQNSTQFIINVSSETVGREEDEENYFSEVSALVR